MANNTKKKTGKQSKSNPLITAAYVVGIALAVGGYVFADASGYLIPGLSPFALAAVIGVYTQEHYQNNKANRDGMLMPQMIILGIIGEYIVRIYIQGKHRPIYVAKEYVSYDKED